MSRVEAGDRLSLVFASWLGMAAALNWISTCGKRIQSSGRQRIGCCVRYLAGYGGCSLLD